MSKLKSNIIYNLGYQVFILIIPFITAPYLSRTLGAEGIGIFSYVSSVAYYFFIFITLGLNNYGNRCIAKCDKNKVKLGKTFCSIFCMQLFMGLLILSIYILFIIYFVEYKYKLFFALYIPYILSAVIDINWFYFGLTEFKFTTIRSLIIRVLSLIFIFLLVRDENDLKYYFIIMSATFLLNNIVLWTRLQRYIIIQKPTIKDVIKHLKPNIVLFVPILSISIYRVMDKIMIKELSSVVENGYYENADKIITMTLTGFSAVATVMMPSISTLLEQGKEKKIRVLIRDTMQISMALGIGMMFGLMAIGTRFAPIFFGTEYLETGFLIKLLSVTIIFSGWKSILRSQYYIPYEKDKIYVISLVASAVLNVIFNLYFIPIYSARGAVIGTIVAEFTGFVIQTIGAKGDLNIRSMLVDTLIFIPPGFVMYLITRGIIDNSIGVMGLTLSIVAGIIVYVVLILVLFTIFNKKRFYHLAHNYIRRG